jgi:putative FmdB family regulatory protein
MALYDYRCEHCGVMEIEHPMSQDALTACPTCGSSQFQRIINLVSGIHFKGTGFYKTDYRKPDSNFDKYLPSNPKEKKHY